jgi:hypothetical protein
VINCGDNKWLYKRTSGELSEYRVRRSNRQILYGYKPSGGRCWPWRFVPNLLKGVNLSPRSMDLGKHAQQTYRQEKRDKFTLKFTLDSERADWAEKSAFSPAMTMCHKWDSETCCRQRIRHSDYDINVS